MKKQTNYTYAYIEPPKEIIEKILIFDKKVPQEWRLTNKGETSKNPIQQHFHITFLLKVDKNKSTEELNKYINLKQKFKVKIKDLYFSKVDRITNKVCIVLDGQ